MNSAAIFRTFLALVAVFCLDGAFRCVMAQASCLAVDSAQKVSDTQGNFTGTLAASDQFGRGATAVGDIDGDGIVDLAVGAYFGGGNDEGAVWVLFMTANGTVSSQQAIGAGLGGFTGSLDFDDQFGVSVCPLGDLNGDGVPDIAVGANQDDDGGLDRGAVWILFLNANGTVNAQQKISDLQGNFTGTLANNDLFGIALDSIGDVNNDGVNDLAVGAMFDDDGQVNAGAVWVLFLNANGTVAGQQKISSTQCGFGGALDTGDRFGVTVSTLGDFNGDGVPDMAVGANQDDDGGTNRGALWMLFLNSNGTVLSEQKISDTQGNFSGGLDDGDGFAGSVALIGDVNADNIADLLVGSVGDDDGGTNRGAAWVLTLSAAGMVNTATKISDTQGNFSGALDDSDFFGSDVTPWDDVTGDGLPELVVTARGDDDGGTSHGALYVLFTGDTCNQPTTCTANQPTFFRSYRGAQNDEAHSVKQTHDGGFVMAGITASSGAGNSDLCVIRTDANGAVQWAQTYGSLAAEDGNSVSIVQMADSGYALVGHTEGFGAVAADVYALRLDAAGNTVWERRIGGASTDFGRSIWETADGGVVLGGTWASISNGNQDGNVLKFDANGNEEWHGSYGGPTRPDHITSVQQTPDGGYIASGAFRSIGSVDNSGYLLRLDANGNKVWERLLGRLNDNEGFIAMDQTSDFGYVMTGTFNPIGPTQDILLAKTDTAGNLLWAKSMGGPFQDRGIFVQETADGGYILTAHTQSFGSGPENVLLIKTTVNGDLEWAKVVGGMSADQGDFWGDNVQQTTDGGYILTGYSNSFGPGGNNVVLVKLNACGEADCHVADVSLTEATVQLTDLGANFPVITGATEVVVNSQVAPFPLNDSVICASCTITARLTASDTAICVGEAIIFSSTGSGGDTVRWAINDSVFAVTGTTSFTFPATGSFLIRLTVSDSNCAQADSLLVLVGDVGLVDLGNDTAICVGDSLVLGPLDPALNPVWQDASTDSLFTVTGPGTYRVTVTGSCGPLVDSVVVTTDTGMVPAFSLGSDTLLCPGSALVLDPGLSAGFSYRWSDSSTDASLTVTEAGLVWLEVSTACDARRDSVEVRIATPLVLDLPGDTTICTDSTLVLDAFNPGATYRWQDASTDSVYRVDTLGFYRVVVSREGCTMADSLIVQEDNFACLVDIDCQVLVPNVFTPNDDAINDQFLVRTTCAFTEFKLTIFNRWGDVVYETNNPSIGWDGSTNGVTVSDGVYFWVMDFQHNVVVNADRQRQVGTVTVLY